jgi:methyl-accepting chemotaxis protein
MPMNLSMRNWSIQTKIVSMLVLFTVVLLAVLFWLYAINEQDKMIKRYVDTARVAVLTVEGTRDEMEVKWRQGIFTPKMMREFAEAGDKEKMLNLIPVVTAWRSAYTKADEAGYKFRVPKFNPRNPANQPTNFEAEAIKKLKAQNLDETYQVDEKSNAIRYYRAVRLTEMCLLCHGDPASSNKLWGNDKGLDPTGARMENWEVGEIHGAFEVVYSLEEASQAMRDNLLLASVVGLVALSIGFIITLMIARGVSKPIKASARVIKKNSNGDFTAEIDSGYMRRGDEVGRMMRDLDQMNASLSDTMREVAKASVSVAQNAGEISQGNQDLSDRTQQQAAAIEETASAIEEMTSSVRQNAENAEQANTLAQRTASMAKEGGASVARTVEAMSAVTSASNKIADIINVVNEIAFQTNLLALNAAVEAARAGEAGRGFAVVAGEVRNLASRSSTAAKEIQKLITDSVEKVDQGNNQVGESGRILNEIIENVQRVTETVAEISAASMEQAQGIEEVNKAVAQMDNAVQQNAALVEEAAGSSEILANAARDLRTKVQDFNVRSSEGGISTETRQPQKLPAPAKRPAARPAAKPSLAKPAAPETKPAPQPRPEPKTETKPQPKARSKPASGDDFFGTDELEGFEEF